MDRYDPSVEYVISRDTFDRLRGMRIQQHYTSRGLHEMNFFTIEPDDTYFTVIGRVTKYTRPVFKFTVKTI